MGESQDDVRHQSASKRIPYIPNNATAMLDLVVDVLSGVARISGRQSIRLNLG